MPLKAKLLAKDVKFLLKLSVYRIKMIAKAEKLAYQMKHGLRRLLNFVGILTVRNSDIKTFYKIEYRIACFAILKNQRALLYW